MKNTHSQSIQTEKTDWKSYIKVKTIRRVTIISLLFYFTPWFMGFYLVCGIIDITRNKPLSPRTIYLYFLGHGNITWILSPFNLLMDVLSFPKINKGIYSLEQLPLKCQNEINHIISLLQDKNIKESLDAKLSGNDREMIFFKWVGQNIETSMNIKEFHEEYEYIQTIGVSVFNKRKSTNKHFGPLRMTLRVLYNLNRVENDKVYIEVGNKRHVWRDDPLFIFDDTLEHQSFNESDEVRYCAFIDIQRPGLLLPLTRTMTKLVGSLLRNINRLFYNSWTFIK